MNIISPMATGNGAYIVHRLLEKGIPGYRVAPYNPWLTLFPPLVSAVGRKHKADLIHTTPDYGIWSMRHLVPSVITLHNYVLDPLMSAYASTLKRIHYRTDLRWFTRHALERATVLTAVSEFTANLVTKDLGINRDIEVIYNGIDEATFTPANARGPQKKLSVLISGNISERKGRQWIIPIADRLNDGIEILYTRGLRTRSALPSHCRIRSVGNVPHERMPDLYRQADLLLLPTVREGLPMAVLEAMGCGLPIVATRCSSLPELVEDGVNGFLCELGDVDAFADRINLLADSTSLRRSAGQSSRARIEKDFTLKKMVANYRGLFDRVLDS